MVKDGRRPRLTNAPTWASLLAKAFQSRSAKVTMSSISTGKIVAFLACGLVVVLILLFYYALSWAPQQKGGDSSASAQPTAPNNSDAIPLVFPPGEVARPVEAVPAEDLRRQLVQAYPVIDEISVKCATDRCEVVGYLDPLRGEASGDGGDLFRGGLQQFLATRGYKPVSDIEIISPGGETVEFRQWVSSR